MNNTIKGKISDKSILRKIAICIFVVLASWLIGALLETLVYCIPTDNIRKNISRGVMIYSTETDFYMYSEDYLSTMNDNDSDSVILCETAYSTGHPFYDAMASAYPGGNDSRVNNIIAWSFFHDDDFPIVYYSRYWHGYVTFFKPLFYFFTFADMRVIKYILEIAIYGILGLQLIGSKRMGREYTVALFALLVLLNPIIISLAFQYMPCTYIALLATIVILKYDVKIRDEKLIYIMLVSGILTSFFDFLTFPIITLGVPLAVALACDGEMLDKIKHLIGVSVAWSFGYLGMWSGKWVLSSLVIGDNVFAQALGFVKHRTGNAAPDTSRLGALIAVTRVLVKRPYALFFLGVAIYLIVRYIVPVIRQKKLSEMLKQFVPFIILSLYSVIWILATFQHCYENQKFTYRNYAVMAFALVIGVIYSSKYALAEVRSKDV